MPAGSLVSFNAANILIESKQTSVWRSFQKVMNWPAILCLHPIFVELLSVYHFFLRGVRMNIRIITGWLVLWNCTNRWPASSASGWPTWVGRATTSRSQPSPACSPAATRPSRPCPCPSTWWSWPMCPPSSACPRPCHSHSRRPPPSRSHRPRRRRNSGWVQLSVVKPSQVSIYFNHHSQGNLANY